MSKSVRNLSLILVILVYFSFGESYESPKYFNRGNNQELAIELTEQGSLSGPSTNSDNHELNALKAESELGIQRKDVREIEREFTKVIIGQEIEEVKVENGEAIIIFREPATISYTAREGQDGYDQDHRLEDINGEETTIHLTDQDAVVLEEVENSLVVADYEVTNFEENWDE
jgi:antitoxin component of MazEF toxin-antitoxin module